jgi:hypothetical protein
VSNNPIVISQIVIRIRESVGLQHLFIKDFEKVAGFFPRCLSCLGNTIYADSDEVAAPRYYDLIAFTNGVSRFGYSAINFDKACLAEFLSNRPARTETAGFEE